MDDMLKVAKTLAFVALAICLGVLSWTFWTLPTLVKSEMASTRDLIDARISSLEHTSDRQLTDWRTTTETQLSGIRIMVDRRVGSLEKTADKRLASLEGQTMKRIDVLVASADRNLTQVAGGVNDLTQTYSRLPDRIDQNLKPFTDCSTNDFCWPNLATDSMVAFRSAARDTSTTMQSVSKTLPMVAGDIRIGTDAFATQFPVIVKNTSNITANIDRLTKPKWYDRLINYGVSGSLMWFNINRVAK